MFYVKLFILQLLLFKDKIASGFWMFFPFLRGMNGIYHLICEQTAQLEHPPGLQALAVAEPDEIWPMAAYNLQEKLCEPVDALQKTGFTPLL